MERTRRHWNRRRSGFTLLEILIVVGIIALLAAFVVPNLMGTSEGARRDMAESLIKSAGPVAMQLELYRIHVGSYPEDLKGLSERPTDVEENKWRGPYITDPTSLRDPWGRDLRYRFPGQFNQGGYDLWSVGPDGQDGTDDDITNWTRG